MVTGALLPHDVVFVVTTENLKVTFPSLKDLETDARAGIRTFFPRNFMSASLQLHQPEKESRLVS